ncbi:MAG: ABC transporter permease [Williamsia sp.]|nr:ABC transporter permease [Williamsia sp.]
MFRNYLKIALRTSWRNKGFSGINISGLAIGMATCLLITLYVLNELSYDRYNKMADRIVRVVFRGTVQGGELREANVMAPVAGAMKRDFPEVLDATRIRSYGTPAITYKEKTLREDKLAFVDPNFFRLFTLPLLQGDTKTALQQPNSVVITRTVAQKYFGQENPLGKVIFLKEQNASLKVTGLIDEVPANSHFHFGLFASMTSLPEATALNWMSSNFYTYLLLPEGYNYKQLQSKLPQLVDKYIGPQMEGAMGLTLAQYRQQGNQLGFYLQPLAAIHLQAGLTGDMEPYGDIRYVYIFSAVAVFMLLIACINFMNLSTAAASKRAKEVGIRKVMGSLRGQLVGQFLAESLLLTTVALLLAIALVYWALPVFNHLAGVDLQAQLTAHPWVWAELLLFGLLTGLFAGSYPAFFLSAFKPIAVLKSKFSSGGNKGLRNGLVVFQFFISISLMVGTAVVYRQLYYIQHKKLGYEKEQVVVVQNTWMLGPNQGAFRNELLRDPRIASVAASDYLPAGPSNNNNFFVFADSNTAQLIKSLRYEVDENYLPTLGMQVASGRNFSAQFPTDSTGVIVNETAARMFGWNRQALGHTISHKENDGTVHTYHVVGVVKDFHFRSLHELISPLVMTLGKGEGSMIVKCGSADVAGLLGSMGNKWASFGPEGPFSYSFLDERFQDTYKAEVVIGRILGIFAGLTIFVACLGLFGLATFTAEQRTKEIGIRKVLGASVPGIVSMLSKDFLKLVLVAFVAAAPVAWMVMNRWLQDFAYRTRISWWLFGLAALVASLLTFFTISFQSIRAANADPVDSLRNE